MRTGLFLLAGLLLMAAALLLARLFVEHLPAAPNVALALGLGLWLLLTAANLWIGVTQAGYAITEELPILLLLFGVPAAAALAVRWRFF